MISNSVPSITTLKCYVCNSVNDADCANPNTLSAFEKLCTESVDPHCRTISQSGNLNTERLGI